MTRIAANIVIQNVDDEAIVFVDDSTGDEIVVAREDWPKMMTALRYLTHEAVPAVVGSLTVVDAGSPAGGHPGASPVVV